MAMTIADYEKNGSAAEKALIKACREGKACTLGELPPETGEAPTVRAEVIRCLALETTSLHEAGVWLVGARITGILDLRFATCSGRLVLHKCCFTQRLAFEQAEMAYLSLESSHLPGILAQGIKVTGNLNLKNIEATATVILTSAEIGGKLLCTGFTLNGNGSMALNAQLLSARKGFFFRDVKSVTGSIDLASAHVRVRTH